MSVSASGKKIVEDINFSVEDGRIVGFVGPNGAGKTTTLRALVGVQRIASGTAHIGGHPYSAMEKPANTVGVFIDASWMDPRLTVINQLSYVAKVTGDSKRRVQETLEEVGLTSAATRRVKNLSLGMRQRLGIGVALLARPSHYIFDEPINGLDPDGILWFRSVISRLRSEGSSILLSSHVMSELQAVVDDVVVLRDGRLVTVAPITELEGQASHRIRVEGDGLPALAALLRESYAQTDLVVEQLDATTVYVSAVSGNDVYRAAVDSGASLWHISRENVSLEEHYQRLVNSAN